MENQETNPKNEQEFEEISGEPTAADAQAASSISGEETGASAETDPSAEAETFVDVENVDRAGQSDSSPAERFAGSARAQAEVAASALRRGEFMRDAAVDESADSDDRLIGLLCYVTQALIPLVMPILVLLSESSKKRPFQRFHAIQSLALSLVFILFGLLLTVGSTIVALVPLIGWLVVAVVFCLSPLLVLMAYLALVYYGYQAYQGKRFAIPGLTSFLRDQNWI